MSFSPAIGYILLHEKLNIYKIFIAFYHCNRFTFTANLTTLSPVHLAKAGVLDVSNL